MKKRFLITSVLMTLVLLVAVSTATFAWYTAGQAENKASEVELNAAMDATGSIYIDTTNHGSGAEKATLWTQASIDLSDKSNTDAIIMAPKANVTTTDNNTNFVNAEIKSGKAYKTETAVEPVVYTFYIYNAAATKASVAVALSEDTEFTNGHYVLFNGTTEISSTAYNLVSVNGETKEVTGNGTHEAASTNKLEIEAYQVATLTLVLWLDGTKIDASNYKDAIAKIGFTFTASLVVEDAE